jgi:hypothetical protein
LPDIRHLVRTSTHRSNSSLDRTRLIESPIIARPANSRTSSSQPADSRATSSQSAKRKLQLINNFSDSSSDESIAPTQKRRALFNGLLTQNEANSELPRCSALKRKQSFGKSGRVLRKR